MRECSRIMSPSSMMCQLMHPPSQPHSLGPQFSFLVSVGRTLLEPCTRQPQTAPELHWSR